MTTDSRPPGYGPPPLACGRARRRIRRRPTPRPAAVTPPILSDRSNDETRRESGSPTALDAAERIGGERLRDFVGSPLEAERLEALTAFVARRRAEGGAPTDF